MNTRTNTRTRTRIAAGVVLGAALATALPLAASAHVTVTPDAPVAGGYDVLTFAFGHGCDGSATTALRIGMPDGLDSATPTIAPGWSIDIERDPSDNLVSAITYTADEPIADGLRAAVDVSVKYADDAEGTLAFPVEQTCVDGSTSWSETVAEGEDPHSVEHPAPTVTLGAAEGAASEGHDHAAGAAASTEEAAPATENPLPLVLGGGGLVAGLAALVVSLLAYRRTGRRG